MAIELKTRRIDADSHFLPHVEHEELVALLADVLPNWSAQKVDMLARDAGVFSDPNARRGGFRATAAGQATGAGGGGGGRVGAVGHGDPLTRAELMVETGFDMQVLIPDGIYANPFGSPIGRTWEPGLRLALSRAFNNKSAEAQRVKPDVFIGTGIVPFSDVQESCDEARRIASLGLKAITINGNWKGQNWDSTELYPFWQTVQELGLVLYVHHNPFACSVQDHAPTTYTLGWERMRRLHISNYLGFAFEYMVGMASLTLGGVLREFPDLKFCFFEAGGSWLPWAMYTLDRVYAVEPQCARCEVEPSELIMQSCFVAVAPDEQPLVQAIQSIGSENYIIGSDYPHPPSTYPNTAAGLLSMDISDQDKENILGGNLQRLFGIF